MSGHRARPRCTLHSVDASPEPGLSLRRWKPVRIRANRKSERGPSTTARSSSDSPNCSPRRLLTRMHYSIPSGSTPMRSMRSARGTVGNSLSTSNERATCWRSAVRTPTQRSSRSVSTLRLVSMLYRQLHNIGGVAILTSQGGRVAGGKCIAARRTRALRSRCVEGFPTVLRSYRASRNHRSAERGRQSARRANHCAPRSSLDGRANGAARRKGCADGVAACRNPHVPHPPSRER